MNNTENVLSKFKLPLCYEPAGQMIFDADERLVCDVRAWGYLQYFPEAETLQDTLGEMIAKAFNDAYSKPNSINPLVSNSALQNFLLEEKKLEDLDGKIFE